MVEKRAILISTFVTFGCTLRLFCTRRFCQGSFLSDSFFFLIWTFFSRNFSIFHSFPLFSKCVKFNELDLIASEDLTTSDRTPPYIDTYLQLFPNFGNYEIMEKTPSDKN